MKATFGTTFSSSPKLCLHYSDYEANHLYGVNTWYSPSGKKKAQEKLLKQYETYTAELKKSSRIIFGLRKDKQTGDLWLGQDGGREWATETQKIMTGMQK